MSTFTVFFTPEQLDTPIAELQQYGLDTRIIESLERYNKAVYIRDLVGRTKEQICSSSKFQNGIRDKSFNRLQNAMLKFMEMIIEE